MTHFMNIQYSVLDSMNQPQLSPMQKIVAHLYVHVSFKVLFCDRSFHFVAAANAVFTC